MIVQYNIIEVTETNTIGIVWPCEQDRKDRIRKNIGAEYEGRKNKKFKENGWMV